MDLNTIFRAANEGNIQQLMTFLSYDRGLVHKRDQNDDCLIHIAVMNGNADLVKFLLEAKTFVNVAGCSCRTPLHCAICERFPTIVKILLDHDAALHETDSLEENALHKAASIGDITTLSLLLTHKGGFPAREIVNNKNVLGSTPLHNAAHNGHQDAAMLLCQIGADVSLTDDFGYTAQDVAVNRGHPILSKLIGTYKQ